MLLTLEPLQSLQGDCLLLHWGTVAAPKLAVIDGGPGNVYQDQLRPRLDSIRTNRGLQRLPIDLVMVSHVDNDHIVGVKKLFQQLKAELQDQVGWSPRHFSVKRLWHNTFNDIVGDPLDKYYQTLNASIQAAVAGAPSPAMVERLSATFRQNHPPDDADEEAYDVALVLAGHGEGRQLRNSFQYLYDSGEIGALNTPFQKNGQPTLIALRGQGQGIQVDGLTFTIVGPMDVDIAALQTRFDEYITKHGLVQASLLASYADLSIPNLSSIICLVEANGKRILLTGDARGDKILSGLSACGLLKAGLLRVDILKVPHHGSHRNVTQDFFEKIVADTYVFSGNGKHGNPNLATLTWLADARGKAHKYNIALTYSVKEIDANRRLHAEAHHKIWNAESDSLEAFFAARKKEGFAFSVHEGAPVMLDLGDEVCAW